MIKPWLGLWDYLDHNFWAFWQWAVDLDRTLGGGRTRTWGWAVGHIAEHESYHLGKCMLMRNLLPSRRNC